MLRKNLIPQPEQQSVCIPDTVLRCYQRQASALHVFVLPKSPNMISCEAFGSHVGSVSLFLLLFPSPPSAILMLNSFSLSERCRNSHQGSALLLITGRKWPGQLLAIQPETLFGWPTLWLLKKKKVTPTALFLFLLIFHYCLFFPVLNIVFSQLLAISQAVTCTSD